MNFNNELYSLESIGATSAWFPEKTKWHSNVKKLLIELALADSNNSSKAKECQWVCVFVYQFLNSTEMANPNEMKF